MAVTDRSSLLVDATALMRELGGSRPPVLLDCRFTLGDPSAGRAAWEQGHLPGALFLDLERDLSRTPGPADGRHPLPDPDALAERLGQLGISERTPVVVYDEGPGAIAARAWWVLRWLGHGQVRLLDGGLAEWVAQGGSLDRSVPATRSAHFRARPGSMPVVATADLLAMPDRWQLIDARAAPRFRGEVEPIDQVAGHVPGALNLPFSQNLTPEGRFRESSELAALYRDLAGPSGPGAVACMCGSGVTACHTLLALELAGFPGASLYAGSFSEWIRDSSRPVAQGGLP
ncbi:MAG: sulfurtransferase [Chromatiales bacterium]|nr:sulfurtransferase [Chromatiales bacterium]